MEWQNLTIGVSREVICLDRVLLAKHRGTDLFKKLAPLKMPYYCRLIAIADLLQRKGNANYFHTLGHAARRNGIRTPPLR
jgi:hypothetical protein